jgi:hypothetical protein
LTLTEHFLSNLLSEGGDKKLAGAYHKMLSLVDEESRIVGNTTLKIVQEIRSDARDGAAAAGRIEMFLLEERTQLESERQGKSPKLGCKLL